MTREKALASRASNDSSKVASKSLVDTRPRPSVHLSRMWLRTYVSETIQMFYLSMKLKVVRDDDSVRPRVRHFY